MLLFIRLMQKEGWRWKLFQYISCYSLSAVAVDMRVRIIGFNTSHVTLYRCCDNACDSCCRRFNTSHVTLYLSRNVLVTIAYEFQYISCYSLSNGGMALGSV